ncbi:hypothetical protein Sste5344_010439 [Sporothrix stenoceras]
MAQNEGTAGDSNPPHRDSDCLQTIDSNASATDEKVNKPSRAIASYLLRQVEEYRVLDALRKEGWSNPEGDSFFNRQRKNADTASDKTAWYFYKLMRNIGQELHKATGAFTITTQAGRTMRPLILDMCMAPGGFLSMALEQTPEAYAVTYSLPISEGGHKVLFTPRDSLNVDQNFLDITMMAVDMGVDSKDIPKNHPDAGNFLPRQLQPNKLFDLALCDGQVLRTHQRAPYRETREAIRLTSTQLALSLEHLRPGGTMVVLLHRVEDWKNFKLLRAFYAFSSVRLFKPQAGHAKRSSFYMVATNVQSQSAGAAQAIENWKKVWKEATFGTEEEWYEACSERDRDVDVDELLEQFGPTLISLGRSVWKVQADALAKAPFIRR